MKNILTHSWYLFLKGLFKIGLFFSIKKLIVKGTENIPKKGPVIFIGNHQNAFIDAILIPVTNGRKTWFLARSNPFKNKYIAKILRGSNMHPVYRLQDGASTIKNNHSVFETCHELLAQGKAIEIFAEGFHHLDRRIYPLKKGFARIIQGTLEKYPDLEITIVPVGINYDTHLQYPASVSVIYGKPIRANDYIDMDNVDIRYLELKTVVSDALKKLTLHIEEIENYTEVVNQLEDLGIDYLDPEKAYYTYNNRNKLKAVPKKQQPWFYSLAISLWKLNSIVPHLLWKKISRKISEIIFTSTFRFVFVIVIFPLFYILQALLVKYLFSTEIALWYLFGSVVLSLIATKKGVIQK